MKIDKLTPKDRQHLLYGALLVTGFVSGWLTSYQQISEHLYWNIKLFVKTSTLYELFFNALAHIIVTAFCVYVIVLWKKVKIKEEDPLDGFDPRNERY